MRYLIRTGDIIWSKATRLAVAKQKAEDLARRLGGSIDIYDRLKFRKIE